MTEETLTATDVIQYSPTGAEITAAGTEFAQMWGTDEEFQTEAKRQEGDALSLEEKQLMADRHEPFDVCDLDLTESNIRGADGNLRKAWLVDAVDASGKEIKFFLGAHDLRDKTCQKMLDQIHLTGKPVRNVMLHKAFVANDKPFLVFRPWDGSTQSGLGVDVKPVDRFPQEPPPANPVQMDQG